jgi:hypothetical protein
MESERRKARGPGYEQYEDDINWTAGVGKPAGVYWMNGRTVIAGHDTAAEERLLLQGAVLVATLRFDRDLLEGRVRGHVVERRCARRVTDDFMLSGVN